MNDDTWQNIIAATHCVGLEVSRIVVIIISSLTAVNSVSVEPFTIIRIKISREKDHRDYD